MESFIQLRKGKTPRRMHADLDGLKDDELGRAGFTGRSTQLYRRHDPTAFRAVGALAGVDVDTNLLEPTDLSDPAGEPLMLFSNSDCRILLSRRAAAAPFYVRNVDGDELHFVHRGTGKFVTEFGELRYRPGDYVYIPKATTYRQVPDEGGSFVLIVEAVEEFRVPEAGIGGRQFPFDPALVVIPEPAPVEDDGRAEYEVRLHHSGEHTSLFYAFDPCDVEGWRGDNFPFTFNIDDYNVLTSESTHLPPTLHLFMQATGVYVLHFLPRAAESVPGTERFPWYHRNVDYDEIAFYHGGNVFGIDMPAGLLSHAAQGVHHGAPEAARERSRRRYDKDSRVEWKIIAIDTRRRLVPSAAVLAAAPVQVAGEVQV
ncbi:homogentisate 1,2-dioxygenase [Jatrophihabitans sp. GAS493]|uniref:homogentisate 1,2-dioxygenase n=1 Tax=Jatrophihabitans sp. GAS493 TaxID=1907575 RepID=UPI000BB87E3E|nr:homogentisate 1,2-dioxygenase [Jatrophihabitans sp. GAS493]SOD71807.1 homogentisate 1,2-dioxygenase [Jatrophihabitans sp. GAS493]